MNSKQLSIVLGVIVVILLAAVGYMALRDNSQSDTLGQQNTNSNSNLLDSEELSTPASTDELPVITYSPSGLFSETEKNELLQKVLNPFIDWTNNEMRSQTEKVKLTSVTVEKPTSGDFKYTIHAKGNVTIDFAYGNKTEIGVPVWIPDCMGGCEIPDWYKLKYPDVIKEYNKNNQ